MGTIPKFSQSLEGKYQTEFANLLQEDDAELRSAGLLGFAGRLEEIRPEAALEIYAHLASDADLPSLRDSAKIRFDNLLGLGSFGVRFESLSRRFSRDACDPKTIVPMIFASTLAGVTKAFTYGRLASLESAAWYSRGFGAKALATTTGFAAEVPAFALSARAAQWLGGEVSQAPLARDLASAVLTLGSLKMFGAFGGRIFPGGNPALSQAFSFAGLYLSHEIEEELGWRPRTDGASRAMDSLASLFSLGVGGRLGTKILGAKFRAFQIACEASAEEIHLPNFSRFPSVAMSVASKPMESSVTAQEIEAAEKGYILDRGLKQYREILSLTLMGDLVRNIEGRLAESNAPLRVLDLGSGKGLAARELKERFGDLVRVETLDRYPTTERGIDRHYEGDLLKSKIEGEFDLILSVFGPHAHHDGRLFPMLRKVFSHLAPRGEFAAVLTAKSLQDKNAQALTVLEEFPYVQRALGQGFAVRFERQSDAALFYAQRISESAVPSLENLLRLHPPLEREIFDSTLSGRLAFRLRGLSFQVEGTRYFLDDLAAERFSRNMDAMGLSMDRQGAERLVQEIYEDFVEEISRRYRRRPTDPEIRDWLQGREPSALWQKPLLMDALVRREIRSARGMKTAGTPAALALGLGFTALLGEKSAFASPGAISLTSSSPLENPLLLAAGVGLTFALGLKAFRYYRDRKLAPNPTSEEDVAPVVISTEAAAARLEKEEGPEDWWNTSHYLESLPRGWVKKRRKELETLLNNPRIPREEKASAVDHYFKQFTHLKFPDAERIEASGLLWDLCWNPRIDSEYRAGLYRAYRILLAEPRLFPPDSPRTYREALRLRSVYSDAKYDLAKRIKAADAYGALVNSLSLDTKVGFGEARMARQALKQLLRTKGLEPGTRDYFEVNSPLVEIERKFRDRGVLGEEED
ncbi:MAG: class I SAM-dependent methyltransferase [Deltaproteobacteria bacterium]|nr:class I SAM-dependent methyltransferase [Deltaproteobacteria bacterium]